MTIICWEWLVLERESSLKLQWDLFVNRLKWQGFDVVSVFSFAPYSCLFSGSLSRDTIWRSIVVCVTILMRVSLISCKDRNHTARKISTSVRSCVFERLGLHTRKRNAPRSALEDAALPAGQHHQRRHDWLQWVVQRACHQGSQHRRKDTVLSYWARNRFSIYRNRV